MWRPEGQGSQRGQAGAGWRGSLHLALPLLLLDLLPMLKGVHLIIVLRNRASWNLWSSLSPQAPRFD